MQFIVKKIKNNNIKDELLKIGFDKNYIKSAVKKHKFLTLKIQNLKFYMATIIKQTALSNGCDAGVNRDVLTHNIESSDLILSGTIKQLELVCENLLYQPFGLKSIGEEIKKLLIENNKSPQIMGILNITEDSFSDGGKFLNTQDAIAHGYSMLDEGAAIIDIGAESTRPQAKPVDIEIEIERLTPVVKEFKKAGAIISIDTRNSATASKMLDLGADIINDVSGLNYDSNMLKTIKNANAQIVIMHSRGTPLNMDNLTKYDNLTDDIFNCLKEKIESTGIDKSKIIIDTGFGFAKDIEQNFELMKKIEEFNSFNLKTLAGVSRKRFLKSVAGNNIDNLDDITALSSFYLFESGIDIVRVHNVKKTKLALDFYNKLTY